MLLKLQGQAFQDKNSFVDRLDFEYHHFAVYQMIIYLRYGANSTTQIPPHFRIIPRWRDIAPFLEEQIPL